MPHDPGDEHARRQTGGGEPELPSPISVASLIESLEMARLTDNIPSDLLAWYQRWGLHFSETSE